MPINVAILGTDAVLAFRPVEPLQLTRACHAVGFDFVAPVSWGEELIAFHIGDRIAGGRTDAVASSCPFVSAMLLAAPPQTPVISTVSPPVACARYLREVFRPRSVHVTYVGACPGALNTEIDDRCLPDMLIARFLEAGIDPSRQPRVLEGQLPAERARYASIQGGAPDAGWLLARAGARLIEAAPLTVDAIAASESYEGRLMDLASACRCICARDRAAATRHEPDRAPGPVVMNDLVSVTEGPLRDAPRERREEAVAPENVESDRKATFAENGLSAGDAASLPSMPPNLTTTREPW